MDDAAGGHLELRRYDLPDPAGAGEDEALVARIRDKIAESGPMPFVRFMDLALYDPQGGYYRAPDARPGRAGDFVTAPELHPIFGHTLARAVLETWEGLGRPDPFVVQEHGAGEGAMAMPLPPRRDRRPPGRDPDRARGGGRPGRHVAGRRTERVRWADPGQ
jgi:hypothetical protein